MSAFDSRTKLEAFRDHMETFAKGANYLIVGHSAGLIRRRSRGHISCETQQRVSFDL